MICDHCGLTVQGFSTVTKHDMTIAKLCHTNAIGRPDCYRRVTVYHEPLGILKNVLPLPTGVDDVFDPGMALLRELTQLGQEIGDVTVVCVTHRRFIPCRKTDGTCAFSSTEYDVNEVRKYQMGENNKY